MQARDANMSGKTLLQVLVGIAMFGFVLAASIPGSRAYRQSLRIATAGEQLSAVCRQAQTRAVKTNHAVFIEIQLETDAIAIVEDVNDNGLTDAGETVERIPLGGGLDLASTTLPEGRLKFDPRGRSGPGGDVLLRAGPAAPVYRFELPAGTGSGVVPLRWRGRNQ